MSKEIDWSPFYGEGEIVCTCDQCKKEERFEFEDNYPDYAKAQRELREIGWQSIKSKGVWLDFCCERCRNTYIKENL